MLSESICGILSCYKISLFIYYLKRIFLIFPRISVFSLQYIKSFLYIVIKCSSSPKHPLTHVSSNIRSAIGYVYFVSICFVEIICSILYFFNLVFADFFYKLLPNSSYIHFVYLTKAKIISVYLSKLAFSHLFF